MTFSLIVEDGSIVSGANSYISVADAADIIAIRSISRAALWNALDPDVQAMRLANATAWLDTVIVFEGQPVTNNRHGYGYYGDGPYYAETIVNPSPLAAPAPPPRPEQALAWPRRGSFDRDLRKRPHDKVPQEVRIATALAAVWLLEHEDDDPQMAGLKRFRADTFDLEFQANFFASVKPPLLKATLHGLGQYADEPGFKKIRRV